MAKLRQGPSGPPIVGTSDGDLLVWSEVDQEWYPQGAPTPGITEFDFIIESRQDLVDVVAPVGGEFLLPRGSYFFKAQVTLNDGERAVVDGTNVFMMGGGVAQNNAFEPPAVAETRGLVGNYADNEPGVLVRNAGQLYANNMVFGAASTARYGVQLVDGDLRLLNCVIETGGAGTQAGLQISDGAAEVDRTKIGESGTCILITGGVEVIVRGSNLINFGVGRCLELSGTSSTRIVVDNCRLRSADVDRDVVTLDDPAADIAFFQCNMSGTAGETAVIRATNIGEFTVSESKLNTYGGGGTRDGIVLGTIAQYVEILSNIAESLSTFLYGSSGVTCARAHVINNSIAETVSIGVDWADADLPTSGLVETGNIVDATTPFANHTAAGARVVRRACWNAATLLTETAIVP